MKPDPERPEVALCVDVLAPEGYGEIIGGGQRIDDYDLLVQRIEEHGLPKEVVRVVSRSAPIRQRAARRLRDGHRARGAPGSAGSSICARRFHIRACCTDSIRMKIGFLSLGCPKNLVDGEVMLGIARDAGHEVTSDASDADVLVVNTCAFIESAKQESIDAILEMAEHKRDGNCTRLVVTGCLAERYRDELRKEIPEIDAVLGTGEVPDILTAIGGPGTGRARRRDGAVPLTLFRSSDFAAATGPTRRRLRPSDLRTRRSADLHLRRRHAAPPDDAAAFRVREDRRRLRLHVRVLHHPDAARLSTEAARPSRSCAKRARWPSAACANCC